MWPTLIQKPTSHWRWSWCEECDQDLQLQKFGYKTVVMGASFRNSGEIRHRLWPLTIGPKFLEELQNTELWCNTTGGQRQEAWLGESGNDWSSLRKEMNEGPNGHVDKLSEGNASLQSMQWSLKRCFGEAEVKPTCVFLWIFVIASWLQYFKIMNNTHNA